MQDSTQRAPKWASSCFFMRTSIKGASICSACHQKLRWKLQRSTHVFCIIAFQIISLLSQACPKSGPCAKCSPRSNVSQPTGFVMKSIICSPQNFLRSVCAVSGLGLECCKQSWTFLSHFPVVARKNKWRIILVKHKTNCVCTLE